MATLLRVPAAMAVAVVALIMMSGTASAQPAVQHGIGLTKGCTSPTKVGDAYTCTWTIKNVLDEAQDTLTANQLVDTVHAQSGNVTNSTILDAAALATTGGAT